MTQHQKEWQPAGHCPPRPGPNPVLPLGPHSLLVQPRPPGITASCYNCRRPKHCYRFCFHAVENVMLTTHTSLQMVLMLQLMQHSTDSHDGGRPCWCCCRVTAMGSMPQNTNKQQSHSLLQTVQTCLQVLDLAIQAANNHACSAATAAELHPAVVLLLVHILLLGNFDAAMNVPLVAGTPSPHTGQPGIIW